MSLLFSSKLLFINLTSICMVYLFLWTNSFLDLLLTQTIFNKVFIESSKNRYSIFNFVPKMYMHNAFYVVYALSAN